MGRRRSRGAMSVRSVAAVLFALCSAATLAGPASAATAAAQPLWPDGLRESGVERRGSGGPQQQPRRGQRTGPAQEGRLAEHAFPGDHGLLEPRHEIAAGARGRIEATVATSEIAAKENAPSRGRAPRGEVVEWDDRSRGQTAGVEAAEGALEKGAPVGAAQEESLAATAARIAAGVLAALVAAAGAALGSAEPEARTAPSLFSSHADGAVSGGGGEGRESEDVWGSLSRNGETAAAVDSPGRKELQQLQPAERAVRVEKAGGRLRGTVGASAGARRVEGAVAGDGDVGGVYDGAGTDFGGYGVQRILQEVTPTPAAVITPTSPAPVTAGATTPAPTTPAVDETDAPETALTPAPVTVEEATLSPSSSDDETIAPSLADGETPSPSAGETVAPAATLAPGATPAPGATAVPAATLAPGTTLAPGATPAPSRADALATAAPEATVTELPVTASPTEAMSETEEALDTTGEVVSDAATVAVATTAAAATVTAVTASTAVTTTVATTAASSTVTTTATTAASAATAGGGTGGTTSAAGATATTAGGTSNTVATTTGFTPDGGGFNSSATTTNHHGPNPSNQTSAVTTDPGSISSRSPSATLGLLMVFQMQFVSLLRLMEANITEPFMNFLDSLKWLNLHFEVDISFFNCNDEETRFDWANDDNGTWALNTFLVFFLLALLILFHVLLVSYLEASWLSQANAIHRHRLEFMRQRNAEEVAAPFDGRTEAAYVKYLDAQNIDRDLYEQEKVSAERYLRRHSSVWMYFPHVELLFLLLAYQGASAAEARMIYSGCFPLVVLGICAMVVFPVLMLFYVSRIVWGRVRPDHSPLLFEPNPNAKKGCFLVRACGGMCSAWRDGSSMFAWADKGQWISKNDEEVDIDSRKFRIGFEPLFVDYTQKGALYVSFVLFEWFAFGLIAGFVTNGTIQTGAIFVIYVVDFFILLCLRPFSNSIIQCFTTMTVLADALTLGLMCYATFLEPDDTEDSDQLELVYAGALIIQTLAILFFVIPLYMDAFIVIVGTLCKTCAKLFKRSTTTKAKAPIKGSREETVAIFCALLRENFTGCVKSTWRGPTYTAANSAEMQRRRSSLLMPIEEGDSSSEPETVNPSFGRRPTRAVRSTKVPSARHPRGTSPQNALQDFSNHGSGGYQDVGSGHVPRSSAYSEASSGAHSGYSRSSSVQRGGRR